MFTATAIKYTGTFHGRAEEVARVRKEIAAYLGKCPVADDLVLIADELSSNSILHTHSRGEFFRVRCQLSPGSVRIEVEDMGGPWRTRRDDDRVRGREKVLVYGQVVVLAGGQLKVPIPRSSCQPGV
jgi:anti-sigma regulatory factor (Ser/Thr protein kinase)